MYTPRYRSNIWTAEHGEEARRLRAEGHSYGSISHHLHVNPTTVRYHLDDEFRKRLLKKYADRRLRARDPIAPERIEVFLPSHRIREAIATAARIREIAPETLAARILQTVINDNLLAAVLDDGKPSGRDAA